MTNAKARFNNSLRPRKPQGSLGRTAQDGHLDSHTAPELWGRYFLRESIYGLSRARKYHLELNWAELNSANMNSSRQSFHHYASLHTSLNDWHTSGATTQAAIRNHYLPELDPKNTNTGVSLRHPEFHTSLPSCTRSGPHRHCVAVGGVMGLNWRGHSREQQIELKKKRKKEKALPFYVA